MKNPHSEKKNFVLLLLCKQHLGLDSVFPSKSRTPKQNSKLFIILIVLNPSRQCLQWCPSRSSEYDLRSVSGVYFHLPIRKPPFLKNLAANLKISALLCALLMQIFKKTHIAAPGFFLLLPHPYRTRKQHRDSSRHRFTPDSNGNHSFSLDQPLAEGIKPITKVCRTLQAPDDRWQMMGGSDEKQNNLRVFCSCVIFCC